MTAEAVVATCHAKLVMAAQIADATGPHQQKAELVSLATTQTTALVAMSVRLVRAATHLAPVVHAMVATLHARVVHAMVATRHVLLDRVTVVTLHAVTHVMVALRAATTHLVASVATTVHLAPGLHATTVHHAPIVRPAMTALHAETLTTALHAATSVRAMVASVVRLVHVTVASVARSVHAMPHVMVHAQTA